jgi:hypothetical protein
MRTISTITLNDEQWRVGFGNPGGRGNDAQIRPVSRSIVIRRKGNGRSAPLVDSLAHELAHLYFPEIPEDRVEAFGKTLGKLFAPMQEADH